MKEKRLVWDTNYVGDSLKQARERARDWSEAYGYKTRIVTFNRGEVLE